MNDQNRTAQSKQRMLCALEKTHGIVLRACRLAEVSDTTFYRWINEDAEFKRRVEQMDNEVLDTVEDKLFDRIMGVSVERRDGTVYQVLPSVQAIMFYLKYKGKKRGYVLEEPAKPEVVNTAPPVFIFNPSPGERPKVTILGGPDSVNQQNTNFSHEPGGFREANDTRRNEVGLKFPLISQINADKKAAIFISDNQRDLRDNNWRKFENSLNPDSSDFLDSYDRRRTTVRDQINQVNHVNHGSDSLSYVLPNNTRLRP